MPTAAPEKTAGRPANRKGWAASGVPPPTPDFLIQVTSVPVTSVVLSIPPSRHIVALRTPMASAVSAITA